MNLFNNIPTVFKIYIVSFINISILVCFALYSITLLGNITTNFENEFQTRMRDLSETGHLTEALSESHAEIYRIITVATASSDSSEYEVLIDRHKKTSESILEEMKVLKSHTSFPEFSQLEDIYAQRYLPAINEVYSMVNDASLVALFVGDAQRAFDDMLKVSKDLIKFEDKAKEIALTDLRNKVKQTNESFYLIIIAALATSILISFIIARAITKPLVQISTAMNQLAKKQYKLSLPSATRTDEIGNMVKAVDVFSHSMQEAERLAEEQKQETHRKEESVRIIADLVTQSREIADEVNTNVSTIAASVHEMSGTSEQIREQTRRSMSIVERAVHEGEETEASMSELSGGAAKIGEVMEVINDIAEKTNLLALNASIEAARAGEAGRGFAVVADEVKKLSTQTSEATQDIQRQIDAVRTSVAGAVSTMGNIREAVREIEGITASITNAVEEQNTATLGISESMEQATQGVQGLSDTISRIQDTSSS